MEKQMSELKVLPTRERERSADLMEKLEYLMGLAKSGDIESIVAVAFRPSGRFVSVRSGVKDGLHVIGCLETLKHDMMNDMDVPS
jgi:hypothetical protein